MGEKMEATKWGMLAIAAIVILVLVVFGMQFISKRVEREVLVTSHQYQTGIMERVAMFEASLAEIDARLSTQLDPNTRMNLEAQRTAINAQISAARRMK